MMLLLDKYPAFTGLSKAIFLLTAAVILFYCGCTGKKTVDSRRKSYSIKYYINTNASEVSVQAIQRAFSGWNEVSLFTFSYAGKNKAGLNKDGKNTVSFLTSWPDDIPFGRTAWCKCWYDRKGNITESDIILNMELARFTTVETRTPDSYFIEGVMAHEIGHMIGLGHSTNPTSVMKAESCPDESWFKGEIDQETIRMYKKLYELIH